MKKVLFIFLLLLSAKVKAVTFYSNYNEFSDYSSEYIEKDELTNVEVLENKKYYINKKVFDDNGEYISEEYDTYESEILLEKPKEKENRVITTHDNSYYLNVPQARYIKLTDTKDMTFKDIDLYIDGKYFFHQFRCDDCFFGSYVHLSENNYYWIDLEENRNPSDLSVYFLLNGKSMDIGFNIEFIDENNEVLYKDRIDIRVMHTDELYATTYDENKLDRSKLVKSTQNDNIDQIYVEDIKYSYVDKIYKKYNLIKEYVNYETDNYDIDKLYRYQKRNKIDIVDNIVITSKNYSLKDYIKATTKYVVTDNIDVTKNGIYSLIIDFDGKEIKRKVTVDIKENNKDLTNELNSLRNEINEKENEIKTILEEKEKVNEEVNTLNQVINNSPKKSVDGVTINKGNSKRIIIIFFIIILLLIMLILYYKKKIS